jgi:type II secretory pathway pseudopilin PulG
MNNKKAFLLFEVVMTIAILSIGLVFVVRSISMCMRVAKESFNYSQAINLAYQKAFELDSQLGGLETLSGSGPFLSNDNFNWEYSVEKFDEEDLGKAILDISWKDNKRENSFSLEIYVKTKE